MSPSTLVLGDLTALLSPEAELKVELTEHNPRWVITIRDKVRGVPFKVTTAHEDSTSAHAVSKRRRAPQWSGLLSLATPS